MDIDNIRNMLRTIDGQIMGLVLQRWSLMTGVAAWKKEHGKPIHAPAVEAANLERILESAQAMGLDADFATEIAAAIIKHSKDRQCELLELDTMLPTIQPPIGELRTNLLKLCAVTAPVYDNEYDQWGRDDGSQTGGPSGRRDKAIHAYRKREAKLIDDVIASLPQHELALDIGCATGPVVKSSLEDRFEVVRAIDVSEDMIRAAEASDHQWPGHVEFEATEVRAQLPAGDNSVSFLVCNFGTASEALPNHWQEIHRVLAPGGKALLSFYNKEALSNFWYYPGPTTLRAHYNYRNDTVEVWVGGTAFTVFAQGHTVESVREGASAAGLAVEIQTYPTLYSLLPPFALKAPHWGPLCDAATDMDDKLAASEVTRGTYITAVLTK